MDMKIIERAIVEVHKEVIEDTRELQLQVIISTLIFLNRKPPKFNGYTNPKYLYRMVRLRFRDH